jgi:hypothetical protein
MAGVPPAYGPLARSSPSPLRPLRPLCPVGPVVRHIAARVRRAPASRFAAPGSLAPAVNSGLVHVRRGRSEELGGRRRPATGFRKRCRLSPMPMPIPTLMLKDEVEMNGEGEGPGAKREARSRSIQTCCVGER